MKCFVALFAVLATASAQFLADTPEVYAAKQQFAEAYNAAARAAQAATPYAAAHTVDAADPGNAYPAAVPYVHEEIPAEPYVHQEVPAESYVHIGGRRQQQQPVQQAAPAYQQPQQYYQPQQPAQPAAYATNNVYNNQPAYQQPQQGYQAGAWANQCFNNKGEGVPCRTNFNQ